MKALIVGAGVAGPSVALALAHVGIESVVLERRVSPDPDAGSYITLASNGVAALDALGVLPNVREQGFETGANRMHGAKGRLLGELALGPSREDGLVGLTMKRSRLASILADCAAARGVDVRYGAVVQEIVEEGNLVEARLQDGRTVSGDLLIGADGVRSRVRQHIDPSSPAARYVGLNNFGGVTRGTPLAAQLHQEAWHFVFGSRCFFGAHPTPEGDVVWFVNVPGPQIDAEKRAATNNSEWLAKLGALVDGDDGPAAELISTGTLELAGDNTFDLGHVPIWSRGRAVLVGDAAHAPSPSAGQGASMALEDAVELARELRNAHQDVPAAFIAYELARRTRVEKIVAAGARGSNAKIPGRIGRPFQELIMKLVFKYAVTERSTAWMNAYQVDWDARVA